MILINMKMVGEKMADVVSLFSGCGGMDLGFIGDFEHLGHHYQRTNFDVIWANDIFSQAIDTYRHNIGNHIVEGSIKEILDNTPEVIPQEADVVIGGFPCQDFSVAGRRQGITVERGQLYLQMKRVIERIAPKVFVAENVEGLVTMENGLILETIMNDLSNIEHEGQIVRYHVQHKLLHAADYGVPQMRKRVFIVGVRADVVNDIGFEFKYPVPTHEDNWVSSEQAIDDLWGCEDDPTIFNHSQLSKAKFYPGRKMQGNVQIRRDAPSFTIRAEHHGNIEGHYRTTKPEDPEDMNGWRRLTVRECARIQTFPDNFEFKGAGTYTYKMVGNAVPPVLGHHMARAVQVVIDEHERFLEQQELDRINNTMQMTLNI